MAGQSREAGEKQERLLRLCQIIGQEEVTQEEADANKAKAAAMLSEFPVDAVDPKAREQQEKEQTRKLKNIGPRRRKPKIKAMINVSKSTFWAGVASGRFPQPVRFGKRITCWRESEILALMEG